MIQTQADKNQEMETHLSMALNSVLKWRGSHAPTHDQEVLESVLTF
jgi:hypothetical protein